MEKNYNLRTLKEDYKEIQEKYGLPSFKEMNEEFGIEKISEFESELLIREVRKFVSDKFSGYLRFVETLLNPVNAQIFVYSILKSLGESEKEKLKEIYNLLSKKEFGVIELDLNFSEIKEVEYIKDSLKIWQEIKKDLMKIVEKVKGDWDNKAETKNKEYLG